MKHMTEKISWKVRLLEKREVQQRSIISFSVLISYLWNCILEKGTGRVDKKVWYQNKYRELHSLQSYTECGLVSDNRVSYRKCVRNETQSSQSHGIYGKCAHSLQNSRLYKSLGLLLTMIKPHMLPGQRVPSQKQQASKQTRGGSSACPGSSSPQHLVTALMCRCNQICVLQYHIQSNGKEWREM